MNFFKDILDAVKEGPRTMFALAGIFLTIWAILRKEWLLAIGLGLVVGGVVWLLYDAIKSIVGRFGSRSRCQRQILNRFREIEIEEAEIVDQAKRERPTGPYQGRWDPGRYVTRFQDFTNRKLFEIRHYESDSLKQKEYEIEIKRKVEAFRKLMEKLT